MPVDSFWMPVQTDWTSCTLPSPRFPGAFDDELMLVDAAGLRAVAGFAYRNAAARAAGDHIASHFWIRNRLNESGMRLRQMDVSGGWSYMMYRRMGEKRTCYNALGAAFWKELGMRPEEAARIGMGAARVNFEQFTNLAARFTLAEHDCTPTYCVHRTGLHPDSPVEKCSNP